MRHFEICLDRNREEGWKRIPVKPLDLPSRVLSLNMGNGLPRPECNHETPPAEEKNSAIDIGKGVENRDGPSFVVHWIDFGGLPQGSDLEGHGGYIG